MTAPLDLDLDVEAGNWAKTEIDAIENAVRAALDGAAREGALWKEDAVPTDGTSDEGDGASLLSIAPVVEVGVRLSDAASVRILNRDYRGKDNPTNVLSFAALESADDAADFMMSPDMPLMLGDIVIARETCEREAVEQNKTLDAHWAHMMIHAVLHLCGYDHINDGEAAIMEALEVRVLDKLGFGDPYSIC